MCSGFIKNNVAFYTFQRPHFCPIHNLPLSDKESLPPETMSRGVDTGAVTIVESADEKVLLIRRPAHLRTFPGVWVPPGGHFEVGEQVIPHILSNKLCRI